LVLLWFVVSWNFMTSLNFSDVPRTTHPCRSTADERLGDDAWLIVDALRATL
jgi:hypothetical protein